MYPIRYIRPHIALTCTLSGTCGRKRRIDNAGLHFLIFGAAYTLWMVKQVFFGPAVSAGVMRLQDISGWYVTAFILLAIGVLWIGVYPQWMLNVLNVSMTHLLQISLQSRVL